MLNLLFRLGHWHGLAKLRMHSDLTVDLLDQETTLLGDQLRAFKSTTCSSFHTRELRKEASARQKKEAKAKTQACSGKSKSGQTHKTPSHTSAGVTTNNGADQKDGVSDQTGVSVAGTNLDSDKTQKKKGVSRKARTLNLNTYKVHALGDYANTIRKYGTTDSYSTEFVSQFYSLFMTHQNKENGPGRIGTQKLKGSL